MTVSQHYQKYLGSIKATDEALIKLDRAKAELDMAVALQMRYLQECGDALRKERDEVHRLRK